MRSEIVRAQPGGPSSTPTLSSRARCSAAHAGAGRAARRPDRDRPGAARARRRSAGPQAHGISPLHEAALLGRRDLVDLLLGAGAELGSRADDGRTALTEALRGKHAELPDYLRSKGARDVQLTADRMAPPVD